VKTKEDTQASDEMERKQESRESAIKKKKADLLKFISKP
jgi:hypothetical protein